MHAQIFKVFGFTICDLGAGGGQFKVQSSRFAASFALAAALAPMARQRPGPFGWGRVPPRPGLISEFGRIRSDQANPAAGLRLPLDFLVRHSAFP